MEAAGLSRTAFYRYFPDLESVRAPAHGAASPTELHAGLGRLAGSGRSRRASSPTRAGAFAAVYRDHGRLMQAFSDAAGAGPDVQGAWRRHARAVSSSRAWAHLDVPHRRRDGRSVTTRARRSARSRC